MSNKNEPCPSAPSQGDVYLCEGCGMAITVIKPCTCDYSMVAEQQKPSFSCCGEAMVKVT